MKLSRRTSWFLAAFGVWSVIIWTVIIWTTFDEKVPSKA